MSDVAQLRFEVVAENLGFPEGPIALSDGDVLVVDIQGGRLLQAAPDGSVTTVAATGGGPNGAAVGPDGAIYVCNNGGFEWSVIAGELLPHGMSSDYAGGSIQRVDPRTGSVETILTACGERSLRGPNDIVFDHAGGFWFTDFGKTSGERMDLGAICYATTDGLRGEVALTGLYGPNGIGLSPDGSTLYWAETPTARLWSAPVVSPGRLGSKPVPWMPGRIVATAPGYRFFDSLAVEADGRVVVGTLIEGGLTVIESDGRMEHIAFPELGITNLCFGGADMCDVWATASNSGRLYRGRWPRPGLATAFVL